MVSTDGLHGWFLQIKNFKKKLQIKIDYYLFLGKMVDISTWHCRIGTFCQKSKKVFHVLKSQGKKVIVTSCYFSCFMVGIDLGFNIFIYLILKSIISL